MTSPGVNAGNGQWNDTRAQRRGNNDTVGESIAKDFKKLGDDQVYKTEAGDTYWDIAEAVQLSNKDLAKTPTGELVVKIRKENDDTNKPFKLKPGTKVDLDKFLQGGGECDDTGGVTRRDETEEGSRKGAKGRDGKPSEDCECDPSTGEPDGTEQYKKAAFKETRETIKARDKDHDGQLAGEELDAFNQFQGEKRDQFMVVADQDGNGKISGGEYSNWLLFSDNPSGQLGETAQGIADNEQGVNGLFYGFFNQFIQAAAPTQQDGIRNEGEENWTSYYTATTPDLVGQTLQGNEDRLGLNQGYADYDKAADRREKPKPGQRHRATA